MLFFDWMFLWSAEEPLACQKLAHREDLRQASAYSFTLNLEELGRQPVFSTSQWKAHPEGPVPTWRWADARRPTAGIWTELVRKERRDMRICFTNEHPWLTEDESQRQIRRSENMYDVCLWKSVQGREERRLVGASGIKDITKKKNL